MQLIPKQEGNFCQGYRIRILISFQIKYWVCFQCKINDPNLNYEENGKAYVGFGSRQLEKKQSSESSYETKLKQSQSLLQMWKPEILQDTSPLITNLANMPVQLYLCAGRKQENRSSRNLITILLDFLMYQQFKCWYFDHSVLEELFDCSLTDQK